MRVTRVVLLGLCLLASVSLPSDSRITRGEERHSRRVTRVPVAVTAYSSGTITASGKRVQPGMIALSRDVERDLGVQFGALVEVEGLGQFVFEDRMPRQWSRRVDIYIPSRRQALQFGIRKARVRVY